MAGRGRRRWPEIHEASSSRWRARARRFRYFPASAASPEGFASISAASMIALARHRMPRERPASARLSAPIVPLADELLKPPSDYLMARPPGMRAGIFAVIDIARLMRPSRLARRRFHSPRRRFAYACRRRRRHRPRLTGTSAIRSAGGMRPPG